MREDVRITVSTRTRWAKYVSDALDSERVTAAAIALGVSEFIRFGGHLTVEIVMQAESGSRMMVWRGREEITVP